MKKKQIQDPPVTVYIYPINDENEPVAQWSWDAEILVTKNQITKHIFGSNPTGKNSECFKSIQEAFEWVYGWLTSNGYDTSNLEFETNVSVSR